MVAIMKKFFFCIYILVFIFQSIVCKAEQTSTVKVTSQKRAKLPLLIGVINTDEQLTEVSQVLKKDLSFSGQFEVSSKSFKNPPTSKDFNEIFKRGFVLAIFLNHEQNYIEWRVYDVISAQMVQGKKYTKRGQLVRGWAHNIADHIWPVLTNAQGCFSTKIAYSKEVKMIHGKKIKHICIADYDGNYEETLVDMPTVSIAPRWNKDPQNPLLFYSEYTNENVRLMSITMGKRRKISSNFDGINMLPTFSQDGKKVVYCASNGKGSCQLFYADQKVFKQLIHNEGNNVSPSLSDDGSIVFFCSDFQTGSPQVYKYTLATDCLERITDGGYCASPSYCAKREELVYTKMMRGTMQLFLYDLNNKKHRQLTFDEGNKEECSWSPCGNYIIFSYERNDRSRIALINLLTQERKYITSMHYNCSYPAWSPLYA